MNSFENSEGSRAVFEEQDGSERVGPASDLSERSGSADQSRADRSGLVSFVSELWTFDSGLSALDNDVLDVSPSGSFRFPDSGGSVPDGNRRLDDAAGAAQSEDGLTDVLNRFVASASSGLTPQPSTSHDPSLAVRTTPLTPRSAVNRRESPKWSVVPSSGSHASVPTEGREAEPRRPELANRYASRSVARPERVRARQRGVKVHKD